MHAVRNVSRGVRGQRPPAICSAASQQRGSTIGRSSLRRTVGIFLVLVACLVLYALYSLHLGIRSRIRSAVESTGQKIEVWLDRTPPTTPQNLRAGPAPTIERAAGYYNATHLTE